MTFTLKSAPEEYNEAEFWASIAEGPYEPKSAKESQIRTPRNRLLHRLIASTILHKHGSEKVPTHDLFLLWCLITPGRHLNFPFVLATYLSRKVTIRDKSPMCGGAFVTKLAESYGLLSDTNLRTLTASPPSILEFPQLERMNILERGPNGSQRIFTGNPVRARRRRRREPQQEAGPEREVDLRYLADQVQVLQVQSQWIGASLSSFFAQQNFRPPHPFPSSVPPFPDWYQPPHHSVADPQPHHAAAGTSTAHDPEATESETEE